MNDINEKIISELQNNKDLMNSLAELIIYEKTRHDIHDKSRPCYKGDKYDQCDDCYSGDTEYEHDDVIKKFFKKLAKNIDIPICQDSSDGEDDSSE